MLNHIITAGHNNGKITESALHLSHRMNKITVHQHLCVILGLPDASRRARCVMCHRDRRSYLERLPETKV